MEGTLRIASGCIWLDAAVGGTSYLVLWPPGTDRQVTDAGTVQIVHVPGSAGPLEHGARLLLGGGEQKDQAFVRDLIGAEIPAECRSPVYWMTTQAVLPDQGRGDAVSS
jgi:hypothetical protein